MAASPQDDSNPVAFRDLGLSDAVMAVLSEVGYETPSPIQAATIPPLLAGRDVLGQAQTGTGKTAAFALPILSRLRSGGRGQGPQALVLTPTRELTIQVAEAFQRYASHVDGFAVLPIYGGQSYGPQLSALKRGVDVVVGTPGRVMDHIKRGTLRLGNLGWMVLDEADEMLRMGFIDDVEWIFEQTPAERQVALFSATMPSAIRRIAKTHLKAPQEVTIQAKTTTAVNIRQRYWIVGGGTSKLDALTRLLEAEPFDAMIVFARTKKATDELAERLSARGYACAALNGDIAQTQRERTVARLKNRQLDILVATDVAARGLDVERISHVINFDIPHDTESYVHRIGRTGRAGREGDAILFVTMREKRLFKAIERATRQSIEPMDLPSVAEVNEQRVARFKQRITDTLNSAELDTFRRLIDEYRAEHNVELEELAPVLAYLAQGDEPLMLDTSKKKPSSAAAGSSPDKAAGRSAAFTDGDLETFRIEVGRAHGVEPRNIVGAIANEAGVDSKHIGRIDIRDDFSLVDLPKGMPKEIFEHLKTVWVANRQLAISRDQGAPPAPPAGRRKKPKTPKMKKSVKSKADKGKPKAKRKARKQPAGGAG
ncbi:DEAD/DEAH box helicase [Salinisphaera sp.]|uniref:DEAD/DEAH box helicase n=1 Tax=Salinisphaera sp. TaxID=1914330 RepID=UPI000C59F1C4|nr:DEAD/DEAH box helicase [Salinisphaera sp.]MAS10098.1 ATP-dependent RNA helicase [Salinisphaera sp.]|tara:strand:- start:1722 stop:3521 length:1800 start_codon:yes stop_codon:yes gene_type:complete